MRLLKIKPVTSQRSINKSFSLDSQHPRRRMSENHNNEAANPSLERNEVGSGEDVPKSALQQSDGELEFLKSKILQLEAQLSEAQKFKTQHIKETEIIEELKAKSEDTLTKAKGLIFERTKVIKNQELQIEALNQQITALKDVVKITKDLLEIRNFEVKQLEAKIAMMEEKVGAEKERHDLMHKKLEQMIRYNGDLKREYETQLCLFTALRERYNEKELARGVLDAASGSGASSNRPEDKQEPQE